MTRPRVAFLERQPASGFIALDRACLEDAFAVEPLPYSGSVTPAFIARSTVAAFRCDVLYAWFASEHSLVPGVVFKLLHRRFVLVPGGYDYANVPERNYGLAARGRGWVPRLLGRLCDIALPISKQTRWEFLRLVPSAAPRTRLGYLAVDPDAWTDPDVERDPDAVVTVAYVDREQWSRKGIDRFVAAARADPRRRYVLGGRIDASMEASLRADAPSNLEIVGSLSHDELRQLFWSCGAYVQLSWHETFGVAMAEAMLCGCVPVIGASPALREVAGRWAVEPSTGESDVDAIARATTAGRSLDRASIRRDIAERFSVEARRSLLRDAVLGDGLTG
jgi:glycosyltransferase involved in cell wall biosynthesis